MPSSTNRRRLEIPTALYARLDAEAQRRQMTTAALATTLLADGLDAAERGRDDAGELRDVLRRLLDGSERHTAELRALRRELMAGMPPLRADELARVVPPLDPARALESQDWAELRVAERNAPGQGRAFGDALAALDLPPATTEYLRLLLIGDLTQSADLRAVYLRRVAALRARLATDLPPESPGDGGETDRDEVRGR